ncbi:MAG: AraC family transcriptional regulator [Devosia sp.]|nr:AraC family transcriptional regulator [Devosia sp.]
MKLASFTEGGPILAAWDYVPRDRRPVTVLPDGCRDLIVRCDPATGARSLIFSGLDAFPQTLALPVGQRYAGLRLRAGVTLPSWLIEDLRRELARRSGGIEPDVVGEAIASYADLNDDLLGAVTAGRTVLGAARLLGVSERTLHRRMIARTGRPPSFWLDLARARRALACLSTDMTLVEIAMEAGFADQAHFTRSFGARFGEPPGAFRTKPTLMRLAQLPGFSG